MPRIISCHLRRCSQNHKSDRTEEAAPPPPCKGSRGLSLARVYVKHIAYYSRNWRIYGHHGHTLSVTITRANCVRTAGEAGQVAWRIPAASAAGIVRSGPGAGRDVRGVGDRNGSFVGGRRHSREQGLLLKYAVPWSVRKGERRPCFQRPGPLRADPKGWLFMRGKGGGFRAVLAGPKGNLSVIPAALSRSRGALSPAGP